jgi:hypothetical protein
VYCLRLWIDCSMCSLNCWCKTRRRRESGWERSEMATCSCVRVARCESMRSVSSLEM